MSARRSRYSRCWKIRIAPGTADTVDDLCLLLDENHPLCFKYMLVTREIGFSAGWNDVYEGYVELHSECTSGELQSSIRNCVVMDYKFKSPEGITKYLKSEGDYVEFGVYD